MPDVEKVISLIQKYSFFVFPCAAGTKTPPSGLEWKNESTNDEAKIRAWAKKYPGCNWAVHHGKSSTVALDIDVKNGGKGLESFNLLDFEHGIPDTLTYKSPSGGFQKIYRVSAELDGNRSDLSALHPQLEVLRNSSYSLIPPSRVNGKSYKITMNGGIAPAPDFIAEFVGLQQQAKERVADQALCVSADSSASVAAAISYLETATPAIEGQGGDNATFRTAAHLRSIGVSEDVALVLMEKFYNPRCVPPWGPDELAAKVANAYRYAKGSLGEYSAENAFKGKPDGDIAPPDAETPRTFNPTSQEEIVAWMNKRHAFGTIGASSYVVFDQGAGQKIKILKIEAFNQVYANTKWNIQKEGEKKPKYVTWAKLWISHPARREFNILDFAPHPAQIDEGDVNLWRDFSMQPAKKADVKKFALYKEHVEKHVCGGDQIIIKYVWDWCADLVQNPGAGKPGVAIVLKGGKGSGKGTFAHPLLKICEPHSKQLTQRSQLIGNFNGHLSDLILAFADEASWPGEKAAEGVLKGLITEEHLMVERKGVDAYAVRSFMRLIMASNEDWVCPASHDERRYLVLNVDHERAQDHDFFGRLKAQLDDGGREHLFRWLLDRDIFGANLRQAPTTDALLEQKDESLNAVGKFWLSILEDGVLSDVFLDGEKDWPDFILRETLYAKFEKHANKKHHKGPSDFFRQLYKFFPDEFNKEKRDKETFNKRALNLPSLKECRDAFSKYQRQDRKWEN